jgi:hypothetical protein
MKQSATHIKNTGKKLKMKKKPAPTGKKEKSQGGNGKIMAAYMTQVMMDFDQLYLQLKKSVRKKRNDETILPPVIIGTLRSG